MKARDGVDVNQLGIAGRVRLLEPGRSRRHRSSASWLWGLAVVLAVLFVVALLVR